MPRRDFPGDPVVKTPACNTGGAGLIPGHAAQHSRKIQVINKKKMPGKGEG